MANTFGGVMADEKNCRPCLHKYVREVPLSVQVRNNKNVIEALEQYVKGDLLSDDNAYFCEKCQKKLETVKRSCIKSLPSTLILQLKRFDYDWDNGRPIKFNDHFTFPRQINMEPYTSDYLAEKDREELAKTAQPAAESDSEIGPEQVTHGADLPAPSDDSIPPQEPASTPPTKQPSMYELSGVVVHMGTASAGHYISFVRVRDQSSPAYGKWLKFNDNLVEEIEMTDETMEREFFGGKYMAERTESIVSYATETERNWSAYLIIYDRIDETQPKRKSEYVN